MHIVNKNPDEGKINTTVGGVGQVYYYIIIYAMCW